MPLVLPRNNPAPNLCSTLAVGEYICCSAGSLHDLAPSPSADGTCYTDDVKSGDSCSAIAAQYTLTIDDINQFNSDRGWCGCDDLQAGSSICFSTGNPPTSLPISNAVCGPQVPGTDFSGTNAGEWDALILVPAVISDLHGSWDFDSRWSEEGCPAGNCLYSHVNLIETMWALAMITKADVSTTRIVVGVASYGRSFQITTPGCFESSCTWNAPGEAVPCTQTAGYMANAEINQILQQNPSARSILSVLDSSNILVYNQTQYAIKLWLFLIL